MEYARIGCACLIAAVFAASALAKLRDPGGFRRSVRALAPVPAAWTGPLAAAVVAAELAAAVLAAVPATAGWGFALAGVLLASFTAAIAAALRRGRRPHCRCFGASGAPIGPRHLVRNAALLAVAAVGAAGPAGAPQAAGLAVAAVAGFAGALLFVAFDDVVDLFARSS
ncbi:MauE/DoxX family redox-associated membrane protein [Actinomadura parmotrematis]|uniref:Methylamine utilisation protein MauE domain-containing protein n=1 Tax=Actinomadura parmotrematis TaxID=2864039 RepID=A0ABS7G3J5_9ACTN|nr:MauE/DoxX family redox-associated membrane protein [Actinomadura parmotrematis]MBW8486233.1 hypothetical protein [Actinomadura parmotrematis]